MAKYDGVPFFVFLVDFLKVTYPETETPPLSNGPYDSLSTWEICKIFTWSYSIDSN